MSGVQYKSADRQLRTARGHLTIVCDGMYSSFRKQLADQLNVKHPSYFVGLILRNQTLPFPNHGHVVLAKPSPILFYPIASNEVRARRGSTGVHRRGGGGMDCQPART